MSHFTSVHFWVLFNELPADIQALARESYRLLSSDSRHPSLQFKKVGKQWSVRVGRHYRALGMEVEGGILWGWIGSHADYDQIVG